jgi:glucosamine-6-phosphate deaminase
MQIVWLDTQDDIADEAARQMVALLARKPEAAIALPTGRTPLGLYARLVSLQQAGKIDCRQARFFNLDEFVGKGQQMPGSYAGFLWRYCFGPLGIDPAQVRLLRGDADDRVAECRAFEQAIADAGGLDLAILGLGTNGHIAFNEPGSAWESTTREVELAPATRQAQQPLYAEPREVPERGLTMGIATIRAARTVLLLAAGASKAEALRAIQRGQSDRHWPVTGILDHPELKILADLSLRLS